MAYGISRDHKLEKKRKQLDNTTEPYSATSTPSYIYYKMNENNDITSKKTLTAETHSITIFSPLLSSFTTNMNPNHTQKIC